MALLTLPTDYQTRVTARQAVLQQAYDTAYRLTGPDQRRIAEALTAQIGTTDWESEGYQSPDRQRDLSIKFHWGHNHRFDDDMVIPGRMQNRHIALAGEFIEAFGLPDTHFNGKAVLDVGCWTGGTTLTLKMLGAGRILALEEVRKYATTAQKLARDVYGFEDVTCLPTSLYQMQEDSQFDSVYIPGVIYHLSDPVLALRHLFNRLRDGGDILVESAGIQHDGPMCLFKGNQKHFGSSNENDMSRGGWAWFWPSAVCLGEWLLEAGFDEIRVFWSPVSNRVYGHGVRTGYRDITRAGLAIPDIT